MQDYDNPSQYVSVIISSIFFVFYSFFTIKYWSVAI